jgi:hypothetical protein
VSPNTAFDYFAFRIPSNAFAQKIKFTNWLVDYTAALPVITSQPQPNNLTVQVGSNVTMAVAARRRGWVAAAGWQCTRMTALSWTLLI